MYKHYKATKNLSHLRYLVFSVYIIEIVVLKITTTSATHHRSNVGNSASATPAKKSRLLPYICGAPNDPRYLPGCFSPSSYSFSPIVVVCWSFSCPGIFRGALPILILLWPCICSAPFSSSNPVLTKGRHSNPRFLFLYT